MDTNKDALQSALNLFKCTNRLHMKVFDKCLGSMNIRRSQHRILMYLYRNGTAVSQKDIAAEFEISPAAVAVTLKKLEEGGYILRTAHENDNRYNSVSITDKGLEVVHTTREVFFKVDMLMFDELSAEELETLSVCLAKMHNSLKQMYESDKPAV